MEYPEHRFNSDGFCKDCGVSNARATDKFCDGDDDGLGTALAVHRHLKRPMFRFPIQIGRIAFLAQRRQGNEGLVG